MKDVPMNLPDGFELAAICTREDPRDAFVSNRYAALADLPDGAVVGTSSLRRESQLRARYPHLTIRPLRGNVQTRLRKLDDGEFDAIILAAAGLKRLGLSERIRIEAGPQESLPAVGQGALGIEILEGRAELAALLAPLNDAVTAACVRAERAMSRALNGSCQVPLGGYAVQRGDMLTLNGFVASVDGQTFLTARADAPGALCRRAGPRRGQAAAGQGRGRHHRRAGFVSLAQPLAGPARGGHPPGRPGRRADGLLAAAGARRLPCR